MRLSRFEAARQCLGCTSIRAIDLASGLHVNTWNSRFPSLRQQQNIVLILGCGGLLAGALIRFPSNFTRQDYYKHQQTWRGRVTPAGLWIHYSMIYHVRWVIQ